MWRRGWSLLIRPAGRIGLGSGVQSQGQSGGRGPGGVWTLKRKKLGHDVRARRDMTSGRRGVWGPSASALKV